MPLKNKLTDEYFMRKALQQARRAFLLEEVPIGAVVVHHGKIIGRGFNRRELRQNPLLHAEISAIQQAAKKLQSWRLLDCTLYVTLEPCAMCAGAIVLARIPRVVYAARDPKAGACGSVLNIWAEPRLNHHPQVTEGVLAAECGELLKQFFKKIRKS